MFDISPLELIKALLLWPFDFIVSLFKAFNPISYPKDNELMDNLYDLLEEIELFIKFVGKGPTIIYRSKMDSSFEYYMDVKFLLGNEFSNQKRIGFMIKRNENFFSYGAGSNSGWGVSRVDKKNVNYDLITKDMYRSVELMGDRKFNYDDWKTWLETNVYSILNKYNLPQEFKYIRQSIILFTHDKENHRYVKAHTELLEKLNDENSVIDFVKEIEGAYSARIVIDMLDR